MSNDGKATFRAATHGESIAKHDHNDVQWVAGLGFIFGLLALTLFSAGSSLMNLRADRNRDVICAAAVKYPEFTLPDCPDPDGARKAIEATIKQLQDALDALKK